ncbi:MAG: hypothetical protein WCW03_03500 [Candidatus Paceibacterota bacterium]
MQNITIKWTGDDRVKLEKIALKIICDLQDVFKMDKYPEFTIYIHNNRESYDKRLNKQSESWEVGNASMNGVIDILHPDSLERYSTHSKTEFDSILKHEIVHILLRTLANSNYIPYWLNEGLANVISMEEKSNQDSSFYIDTNFTSRLSSKKDWNSRVQDGAYTIARLFTQYLVKHYSLEKVLALVKDLNKNFYEPSFREKFKHHFGNDLSDVEKSFVQESNH